ncbi:3-oxoacyl-[acyl-carrier-protein] synthase III C-terminal domain-containing protein [Burkholderia gladioli pv. gladioli]|uniref:3-Oxoacyl-[acyl-carrier-(ACP)] synthase III family protein n=1 Tax=Burkholderia gladioli TaxID=28095 RepID=A0A095F1P9_BURGA|nr:3-oxoacyl-[acyl-carrier-protein] synthase III C-terminal domain-containing protein [Burkholderia gladioli]AJW99883.1 3-Oxoacyl-[acyl-carrier-(ACP)] synthase III family protein [Burkholderia gladioli]ASD80058.1 3-oxoacyl-ACP synthase [Burkholderia gladioli pv. gladioli]AWY54694.1 3-oxoacyl-ACP synthase [Burkholderia gladioli pv. gladioli]KGC10915.1 3-Oxoacyl-[acyl-carrier-(ACP)] synthase III family protein [Burkholderia gladioli]MDJ1160344.1 3-oxoacyl-[acyl-carrier-protein] synthase III C-te
MIPDLGIPHVAFHLPPHIDDVRNWAKRTGQKTTTLLNLERAGMRYYRSAGGQTAIGLAASAIQRLLAASGIAPDEVDCIVYVHTLQGSIVPPPQSLPGLLCDRFGFTNAEAFSFAQQHCASALGALRVIRAMFISRPYMKRVLLVGADVMPLESERLMQSQGILGDGAFAAFIERGAAVNRVLAITTYASGQGWRGVLANEEPRLAAQHFFAARSLIRQTVQQAHLALEDIQRILPHHLDLPAWRRLLDALQIPQDRLFAANFAHIGHVTVSDAFINLAQCQGLVPGRPFLLFARGVGGFSAAALLVR